MKVLVFYIGPDRYALRLAAIARVLPALELRQVPLAPACVAGLMDLHGEPVPVIDLSRLAGFVPDALWLDSRIILVDLALPGGASAALGLLAERVTGIDTVDPSTLADPGVAGAPFLGQVCAGSGGMLQLVETEQLLPPDVRALLFQKELAA